MLPSSLFELNMFAFSTVSSILIILTGRLCEIGKIGHGAEALVCDNSNSVFEVGVGLPDRGVEPVALRMHRELGALLDALGTLSVPSMVAESA
jgi:hypothetical protein